MGGTTPANLQRDGALRWTAVVNTAFFVVGFTVVFVVLGVVFSSTFGLLGGAVEIVNIVAGALVILLGINFIFDFIGFLNFERRFELRGRPTGKVGSLVFGMAFGAGWTPCIGPILGSILFLAGSQGSIAKGTTLLLVYSVGLGMPFLLTGFFLSPALRQMAKLKRHLGLIKVASGVFLIFVGILILLGELKGFNGFAFSVAIRLDDWGKTNPLASRILPAGVFAGFGGWIAFFSRRRILADRVNSVRSIRPFRLLFIVGFVVLAALSLAGTLQAPHLIARWLNFQGI
jgi:cytochrome c-type biogenesis protein